eukprot:1159579-Pelagomonas_calceolata.AAC.6
MGLFFKAARAAATKAGASIYQGDACSVVWSCNQSKRVYTHIGVMPAVCCVAHTCDVMWRDVMWYDVMWCGVAHM